MRQLFAVALVLAVVAAPACAQRGGGRGGGFSGHAMGGSRGGFSEAGHYNSQVSHYGYSGYAGGARVQGYRVESRGFGSGGQAHFLGSGVSNARPVFYTRGRDGRRYRRGFGVPYVTPGWADVGYLGYPYDDYYDDGFYGDEDDSGYDAGYGPVDDSGAAPENYVEQPPEQYAQQAPDSDESAQSSAEAFAQDTSPALYDSDAVTLVFKDGRPVEKIQNYALTRTTLYVTGAHHREIPVADLDLAATEKANREAGVSFQLPVAQ